MDWTMRTEMILGEEAVSKLTSSRVAVFGIGGVGGFVCEGLARAGIGALELIDSDKVDITNINRQIIALSTTVGMSKVELMRDRVLQINPEIRVTAREVFFGPENCGEFDFSGYDYVVDAIDSVTSKVELIARATAAGTPVISAMGAGNKLDPTAFRVADIYETSVCPLAKVIRKECRKRGIVSLKVVYSTEQPVKAEPGEGLSERTPGSVSFVPSVMGLIMAGEVIKDLTGTR